MKFTAKPAIILFAVLISVTWPIIASSQSKTDNKKVAATGDFGWPRKFTIDGSSFAIYQPQMEEWVDNRWLARAAFSVVEGQAKQPSYGVLWFTARAEVDKVNRLVNFSEIKVTRMNFPAAPDKVPVYQSALQARAERRGEVIALDRLLADLAVNQADTANTAHDVRNDPPQVFFSTRPAILILIDGNPEFRVVRDTNFERVINTRVLLLHDRANRKFYLRLMDGWLEAASIAGPWNVAVNTPADLNKALEVAAATKQVDLLEGSASASNIAKPTLKEAAKQNQVPDVYVATGPAELLQTHGEPQIAAIEGTQLVYVTNSENEIFVHTLTQDHYILIAGRWFSCQSMKGPWTYVPGEKLPLDFARIPPTHAKANVLVSVPGTPQAREALIANSIPQTATITRTAATLTVKYDGAPQFKRIENTTLQYAVNTATQ